MHTKHAPIAPATMIRLFTGTLLATGLLCFGAGTAIAQQNRTLPADGEFQNRVSVPDTSDTSPEANNRDRERELRAKEEADRLNSVFPDGYGELEEDMLAEEEDMLSTKEDEEDKPKVRQVYKPQPTLTMTRSIRDERIDDGYVQGLINQRAKEGLNP